MLSALARVQYTLDKRLFVPAKSIVFGLLEKGHEKKVLSKGQGVLFCLRIVLAVVALLTTKGVSGWTHIA